MIDIHSKDNIRIKPLFIGFFLSLFCIAAAYWIAFSGLLKAHLFFGAIALLGAVQIVFQLIFFFRLATEKKPRWNLLMFLLMILVIF